MFVFNNLKSWNDLEQKYWMVAEQMYVLNNNI